MVNVRSPPEMQTPDSPHRRPPVGSRCRTEPSADALVGMFCRCLQAAGKMAVLISHRFSTVRLADRILVLDGGRISEDGNHERLLEVEGRYAELFNLQAEGNR